MSSGDGQQDENSGREDSAPPGDSEKGKGKSLRSFGKLKPFAKTILTFAFTLPSLLIIGWLIVLAAVVMVRRHTLELHTISVPKQLLESGFTSEVVTRNFRDALEAVHKRAQTSMRKASLDSDDDAIGAISIPNAGITIDAATAFVSMLLPKSWRHDLSGEMVQVGGGYRLTVRLNGDVNFRSNVAEVESLDSTLNHAAFIVVKEAEPYVAAAALFSDGDLTGADTLSMKILDTTDPQSESAMRANLLRGRIAQQNGNLQDAEKFYMAAPFFSLTQDNLGLLFESQQHFDEAIDSYRRAIDLDDKDAAAHNNLGHLWLQRGYQDAAIKEFNKASDVDPGFSLAHDNLCSLYRLAGHEQSAIDECRAALRADVSDSTAHTYLGQMLEADHRFSDAESEYRAGIECNPRDAFPYNRLGLLLKLEGRNEAAIDEFHAASSADPRDPDSHINLGNMWIDAHRDDDAITEFKTAITYGPSNSVAYYDLGRVLLMKSDFDAALEALKRATSINPRYSAAYLAMGNVYVQKENWTHAIESFKKTIELDSRNPRPHTNMALVWVKLGKYDAAAEEGQLAIKADDRSWEGHSALGQALEGQLRAKEARAEYQTAIRYSPKTAAPYYYLGKLLLKSAGKEASEDGKASLLRDACHNFQIGAQLAPDDPDYRAKISDVNALMSSGQSCITTDKS